MDGSHPIDALQEASGQRHVQNPVEADLILRLLEDALDDQQLFVGKDVLGEGPGKAEQGALAVRPYGIVGKLH